MGIEVLQRNESTALLSGGVGRCGLPAQILVKQ